jgi:hypothetical protein
VRMGGTNEHATVYANVGVHAGVEITLVVESHGGIGAAIYFGHDGPDLVMDFADVDSLERLSAVAADGARRLRERATANGLDLVSGGR